MTALETLPARGEPGACPEPDSPGELVGLVVLPPGDVVVVGVVVVVVPLGLTVIVPFISLGCTVQMNVYVPGVLNVHSPCQLVAPVSSLAAAGIPVQLGVAPAEPPVNFRPWYVALYGLLNLTIPPVPTVAVAGIQEWKP